MEATMVFLDIKNPNGEVNFYIGKKIFDQKNYDMLLRLRGSNMYNNVDYFPEYRG